MTPLVRGTPVRGDPLALEKEFDRLGAEASVQLVFDQRIGNLIVMPSASIW
jgi:hypothetical protein